MYQRNGCKVKNGECRIKKNRESYRARPILQAVIEKRKEIEETEESVSQTTNESGFNYSLEGYCKSALHVNTSPQPCC
jgi:hypothetical protein